MPVSYMFASFVRIICTSLQNFHSFTSLYTVCVHETGSLVLMLLWIFPSIWKQVRRLTDALTDRWLPPDPFFLFVIIFKVCCFLFCVEPHLMRLAVTMFILGVGTSPGGKARVGKSNTMNAGVGGGRPLTSPAPGSVGRRSTISYEQAKTSSSSTERTNEVPRYSSIQFLLLLEYVEI